MLRLRLAALALVSGALITLSGCASSNSCCSEPMFPRVRGLFTSRSATYEGVGMGTAECDCQNGHIAGAADFIAPMPGPQLMPGPTQIPITTVPTTQPGVFRVPQASQMPYSPTIK